jgi:hypothetical protein
LAEALGIPHWPHDDGVQPLALPWGDSERWDFVVWGRDQQRVMRVQVKGPGRLYLGGYKVQPVHSTRRGGKKRYTKKEIDVIAAHVQSLDAWYLIPTETAWLFIDL